MLAQPLWAGLGGCGGTDHRLVDRMAGEPAVGRAGLRLQCRRVHPGGLGADPAYALGSTVLAAVAGVLHPAGPRLAQLAPDSDRRAVAAVHRGFGPARRRPFLLQQRSVHRAAGTRPSRVLEIRRDLRRDRRHQRAARPDQLLHRSGADHPLAAVAQPAHGERLAQRFGLPPGPVRPRAGGQPRSAHPAGRHLVRRRPPRTLALGAVVVGGVAGLLHPHPLATVRPASRSAASRFPGRWSSWPTST